VKVVVQVAAGGSRLGSGDPLQRLKLGIGKLICLMPTKQIGKDGYGYESGGILRGQVEIIKYTYGIMSKLDMEKLMSQQSMTFGLDVKNCKN